MLAALTHSHSVILDSKVPSSYSFSFSSTCSSCCLAHRLNCHGANFGSILFCVWRFHPKLLQRFRIQTNYKPLNKHTRNHRRRNSTWRPGFLGFPWANRGYTRKSIFLNFPIFSRYLLKQIIDFTRRVSVLILDVILRGQWIPLLASNTFIDQRATFYDFGHIDRYSLPRGSSLDEILRWVFDLLGYTLWLVLILILPEPI